MRLRSVLGPTQSHTICKQWSPDASLPVSLPTHKLFSAHRFSVHFCATRQHTEGFRAYCFSKALTLPWSSLSLVATASGKVTKRTPNRSFHLWSAPRLLFQGFGFSFTEKWFTKCFPQTNHEVRRSKRYWLCLFLLALMPAWLWTSSLSLKRVIVFAPV